MTCLLAKLDCPDVDLRKPYTEIGGTESYSGRANYEERYITHFIHQHRLPLNPTTAFLTPALRNLDRTFTLELELIGEPRRLYRDVLQLLDDVYTGRISAEDMLSETLRVLLVMRDERASRMEELKAGLLRSNEAPPLSSEEIVNLLEQHLRNKKAARLPVLLVAAAYKSVSKKLGERILPLQSHNVTNGTEIAILDCSGFLRHFLHFFHRSRISFLDMYQELVLSEPDSAVNQPLKEAFLALRQVAESDE